MTMLICGQHRYRVTTDDRIWLLRAVQCEGRVEAEVAQVLVNCFAHLHSRSPGSATSLTWLVRSYAQPVNPAWFPAGKHFLRWHAVDPVKYSLMAAMRRENTHSKRTVFDQRTTSAVDRALELGPVDVPRNATDYAAAWIDASKTYQALTAAESGKNRLWTRAPGWTGYSVEM